MKSLLLCCPALCLLLLVGCTDPIEVGSDLLGAGRTGVGQTVDLPFTTRLVREDSTLVYDARRVQAGQTFSFGRLSDEFFGQTDHSVYISPTLPVGTDGLARTPGFALRADVDVDSIVLILPIDTARAFYGPGRTFEYELNELMTEFDLFQDYYSDGAYPTGMVSLARDNRFVATRQPTLLHDTAIVDSFLRAHVRVRFDDAFVQRINALDPAAYVSDTAFRMSFPGVYLAPTAESNALINLAPPALRQGELAFSGFYFYYRDTSEARQPTFYRAPFQLWLPRYVKDYDASLAGELLAAGGGSELVGVAGQSGLMTEIAFDDLSSLEGRVINRAVLKFPLATPDGVNYAEFPIPSRVELFYRSADGDLQLITDRVELARTGASPAAITLFLDGLARETDTGTSYSPLFSVHLQRMISGQVPPRLYLRVSPLNSNEFRMARAFLNGTAATGQRPVLQVTFTELD